MSLRRGALTVRRRRSRAVTAMLVVSATLLAACTSTSASVAPAASSTAPLQTASTNAGGRAIVDPALAPAIQTWRGQRGTRKNVRAILVSVEGRMVVEEYYDTTPDVARDTESVTKSVMSTLVGMAIAKGHIRSVDQTLAELLPSYAPTMTPGVAEVTLRQLLTMTGGFPAWLDTPAQADEVWKAPDWVANILATGSPAAEPTFTYSNGSAHLVSAVLTQATGRSTLDFAREVLFDPLGIDSEPATDVLAVPDNIDDYEAAAFSWPVDPQDINLGYALLTLRPADLLKIGQLYLDGGRWQGRQLLPAEWVTTATTAQVKTYDTWDSYGYLWWVTTADQEPAYAAIGAGGQLIEVVPSRRLVVVVSSEYDLTGAATSTDVALDVVDSYDLTSLVNSVIAPAVSPST